VSAPRRRRNYFDQLFGAEKKASALDAPKNQKSGRELSDKIKDLPFLNKFAARGLWQSSNIIFL
jgi:hypothetical protein